MEVKPSGVSHLHALERFELGVIHLDAQRKVLAMNDFARQVLPVDQMKPFDQLVTSFHPERSRAKVGFLLDSAGACPVAGAVPMTMIINIPEQVLLIRLTRLGDAQQKTMGYVLVFYDVTDIVSAAPAAVPATPPANLRLERIPVVAQGQVVFLESKDVLGLESQGHSTKVLTREGLQFCNLSIGDLALRLDPKRFVRVHRCHIVNLAAVASMGQQAGKTVLLLKGHPDTAIPVSRQVAAEVRQRLGLGRRPGKSAR